MKKLITTFGLAGLLLINGITANAGFLMGDFQSTNTQRSCKETGVKNSKTDWGIFVTALTGIFVTAYTGTIVVDGFTKNEDKIKTSANCGL